MRLLSRFLANFDFVTSWISSAACMWWLLEKKSNFQYRYPMQAVEVCCSNTTLRTSCTDWLVWFDPHHQISFFFSAQFDIRSHHYFVMWKVDRITGSIRCAVEMFLRDFSCSKRSSVMLSSNAHTNDNFYDLSVRCAIRSCASLRRTSVRVYSYMVGLYVQCAYRASRVNIEIACNQRFKSVFHSRV